MLRFDLFGRGLSDRPDVAYTIDFFASQVDALTRKLELGEPFNLVGLSMGGPVTTRFTNLHPDWEDRFREQMQFKGFRRAIVSTLLEFDGPGILQDYRKLGRSGKTIMVFWGAKTARCRWNIVKNCWSSFPRPGWSSSITQGTFPTWSARSCSIPCCLSCCAEEREASA